MNPVPAIVVCAVMLIACITGLTWVSIRLHSEPPYQGGHTHKAVRARTQAEVRDDPSETDEPGEADQQDGPDYDTSYDHPGWEPDADYEDWRDQPPPRMPTGRPNYQPGDFLPDAARIVQTSELTRNVLGQVLDGLRKLDTVPRFLPAPGCEDPDGEPDDTIAIPHAVGTWGKTPAQLADELEAEYLT